MAQDIPFINRFKRVWHITLMIRYSIVPHFNYFHIWYEIFYSALGHKIVCRLSLDIDFPWCWPHLFPVSLLIAKDHDFLLSCSAGPSSPVRESRQEPSVTYCTWSAQQVGERPLLLHPSTFIAWYDRPLEGAKSHPFPPEELFPTFPGKSRVDCIKIVNMRSLITFF